MPKSNRILPILAVLLSVPAAAQEETIPDDLQTVVVEQTEVQTLLGEITRAGANKDVAERAFSELVSAGARATPELVSIYEDGEEEDHRRWVCARALGHIGGKVATEALLRGIRSPQFLPRIAAASALGVLQGADARLALEEALFDPSMEVRATAADGLAAIGHQASSLPLSRALASPDSFHRGRSLPVRGHIVIALGRTGGETAIEALVGVLDDGDEPLRATAIKALEEASGANPSGRYGDGQRTTADEVRAWQQWWESHRRAQSETQDD